MRKRFEDFESKEVGDFDIADVRDKLIKADDLPVEAILEEKTPSISETEEIKKRIEQLDFSQDEYRMELIERIRAARDLPEVHGFDKSEVMRDNEVKAYLQDEFPPEHVRREHIREIQYTDKYVPVNEKYRESGHYTKFKDSDKPSEICINRQVPEGSLDADELKETISHEVAHDVYERLSEEEKQRWRQLSGSRDINECVDSYATTSEREDFASTYPAYMHAPEYLRARNLAKYNYMRDHIFEGREYL